MAKRNRPFSYNFRVSEAEKKIIDSKLKASGLTLTDFVIKAITGKKVVVFPNVNDVLNELKRQGNNLNQIVKSNYFGQATERELLSCVDEIKKTYKALVHAVGGM